MKLSDAKSLPGFVSRSNRDSLPSETYIPSVMPQVLGAMDVTSILLLNVYWVSNVTLMVAIGGLAAFTYWLLCGLFFFIPCLLMIAQLVALYPHEGTFYVWTYHILGKGWDFFVGLCFWVPGVISLVTASGIIVSCLQALNEHWLVENWQQGSVIVVVLLLGGILSCQRIRIVFNVLNAATIGMLAATALIVIAALWWLFSGHSAGTNFTQWANWKPILFGPQNNLALLGNGVLAFLGMNMSVGLVAELRPDKREQTLYRHLIWSAALILGSYLLLTFSWLFVLPAAVVSSTFNPVQMAIATGDRVFGTWVWDLIAVAIMFYFFALVVALNFGYGRVALAASIDRRISMRYAQLNSQRVPVGIMRLQIGIALVFVAFIYFILPFALPFVAGSSNAQNLTTEVYNIISASVLLIWAFAFMSPFVNIFALMIKDWHSLHKRRIVPLPLLLLGGITGLLFCVGAIGSTLFNSFIPSLLSNEAWSAWVGLCTIILLVLFVILSMWTSSEANYEDMGSLTNIHQPL